MHRTSRYQTEKDATTIDFEGLSASFSNGGIIAEKENGKISSLAFFTLNNPLNKPGRQDPPPPPRYLPALVSCIGFSIWHSAFSVPTGNPFFIVFRQLTLSRFQRHDKKAQAVLFWRGLNPRVPNPIPQPSTPGYPPNPLLSYMSP